MCQFVQVPGKGLVISFKKNGNYTKSNIKSKSRRDTSKRLHNDQKQLTITTATPTATATATTTSTNNDNYYYYYFFFFPRSRVQAC